MYVWALSRISRSLTHNVTQANPEYAKALEIVQIPERILQFRVVWEDDSGKPHVNRGFRVQVNPIIP
jgi:glutamate dehydrogenase (NADP+)